MITLLIVVCIISVTLAQIKVMQENKSIEKYGWTYCKDARDTARTIRIGALLALVGLVIIRGPLNDFYADMEVKSEAYMQDTFLGEMYVKDYYMDYQGTKSDFHGRVPMCSRCGHTVGSYMNPEHGHKLIPSKDGYVRSCSTD